MKNYLSSGILIFIDLTMLTAIFYLAAYLRVSFNEEMIPPFKEIDLQDFLFVIITIFILFIFEKIYSLRYDFWQETYKILKSLFVAYFIVMALLSLLKTSLDYSRLFITLYFLLALFIMPVVKRLEKRVLYSFDFFKKNVLLVGDAFQREIFKKEFEENWYLGMKPAYNFYDIVIISSKGMDLKEIDKLIAYYLDKNSLVYIIPYITSVDFANSVIMDYSNIRLNTIQIENKLLLKRNIYIKYIFDYLFAIMVLPLFAILHLLISLAIYSDSKGRIFFKQLRLAKDGVPFQCYKYRTMYEDSDKLLQTYLKKNPEEVQYYEKFHKYKHDPRITKVGKFLRTTSLDELAQIVNILKGEMSFVGPRPYMLSEAQKLGSAKHFILKVKPGITGLWQVNGRNNLTFEQRKELEVWYIKNWSLWSDLVILLKTVKVVMHKVGAS